MEHNLGFGIGLRRAHFDEILQTNNLPDWFEVISENVMGYGGKPQALIDYLHQKEIPLINHGVGLNLGGPDEFNQRYLSELKKWMDEYKPKWFSDHLCFSALKVHQYHDLLPILKTQETLNMIVDKINYLQDYFQVPFAFENISYYGESTKNTMSEIEFINQLLEKTQSHLLLDINNIYVNQCNLKQDANHFLDSINLARVIQVHLAGHFDRGDVVIDTHGAHVNDEVWDLYRTFLKKIGKPISTLIEWDNSLPAYEVVMNEAKKAQEISNEILL